MATDIENAAIVSRWFSAVWTGSRSMSDLDALASPDIVFQYETGKQLRGVTAVRQFAKRLRAAFPDIAFRMIGEPAAQEGWVVYHWLSAGTHTGPAFEDFLIGPLPEASGTKIEMSGFSVLNLVAGKIVEEAVWSKERHAQLKGAASLWFL
ncbi:SnoaL-like polyketide cyclase [Rhizobiales bacterium GAS113]|nr:SnoaL-like polyketide cyclase [Rhizobiales bacterium GAS113]